MKHTAEMLRVGDVLENGNQNFTIIEIANENVYYVSRYDSNNYATVKDWLKHINGEMGSEYTYKSKYDHKFEAHKKRMLSV